jgi:transposase
VRTEQVAWARPGAVFTREFEDQLAGVLRTTDKTATSRLFRVSWPTVGRIASRVVAEKLDPERLSGLAFIGIDEFSYQRRHKYVTLVADHERAEPVWIGKGKSGNTLDEFFDALGPERCAALEVVSMDMSAAYIESVRRRAPQAEIVFDRFHLERLVHDALDEVRRREVARLPVEQRSELKNTRFLLLTASRHLTRRQRVKLGDVQRLNNRVLRAYLLKEEFAAIFRRRAATTAEHRLMRWLHWAATSRLEPFRRVARTLRNNLAGVLAYFELGLTNALAEGINRKVRLISDRSFGLKSLDSIAALVYLCCTHFPLPILRAA